MRNSAKKNQLRAGRALPEDHAWTPDLLRQRAEALLRAPSRRDEDGVPPEELQRLVYELQVHQVELEMQNEELRRIELVLEASRDRLSDLFDFAPIGYLTLEREGIVREANLAAADLLGVDRADLIGRRFTRLMPPGSQDIFYQQCREVLAERGKRAREMELRRGTGLFPAEVMLSAAYTGDRTPPLFHVAIMDITERFQALKAVQRSERLLNDFFDQASIGMLWVNRAGWILRVNQAQLGLFGCARARTLNATLAEFFTEPEVVADILHRTSLNETVCNYEARLHRDDGTVRSVLIDANSLQEEGKFIHSRWFVRDITERRELERDVLKATDAEQNRIARDLHDDLGQHLGGLVHLTTALQQQLTALALPEAAMADRVVKLLDEAGAKVRALAHGLQPVPPEPHGLISALHDLAARVSEYSKIKCRVTSPHSVAISDTATANHLFRITQEAVNNALKHTKCRLIEIRLDRRKEGITLVVRDDGCGFFPHKVDGRGIGLRTMRYRAGVIGGSLAFQRGPQGGMTVSCTLHKSSGKP